MALQSPASQQDFKISARVPNWMNIREYEQDKDKGQWPFQTLSQKLSGQWHYFVFITTQYLRFELKTYREDGVSMCIRNAGTYLPRRQKHSMVTAVKTLRRHKVHICPLFCMEAIGLLVLLTNPLCRCKQLEVGDRGGHVLVTSETNKIFSVWGRVGWGESGW